MAVYGALWFGSWFYGADEQRQQMPATGINAFRYWHSEPDNEGEGDRGQGRDGFDSHGDSPVDEENAS